MRKGALGGLLVFLGLAGGCVDTGQREVEFPLMLAGTARSQIPAIGGEVELSTAQMAFGPLFLCPGVTAGDLCETARAQWLESSIIDLLNPEYRVVGKVSGISGPVLSWMYDLGLSSQLSQSKPFVMPAAKKLGGASLIIQGRARVNGYNIPFSASVAAQQTQDTELGVPVVRKSVSETFFRELGVQSDTLMIRFDPLALLAQLDLNTLVGHETCGEGSKGIVCDGMVQRNCDGPNETLKVDCYRQGQVCEPGVGCVNELTVKPESEAYRALRGALLSGARPSLTWASPQSRTSEHGEKYEISNQ